MKATVAKITPSGKSACVMVQTSEFSFERKPAYIPNNGYEPKQELEIPNNHVLKPWITKNELGELVQRVTKEGIPLMILTTA